MQFTTLGSARGAARKGRFPTATIGSSPATSTDASGLLPHDMVTFLNNLQLYGNRSHEELRGIRRILELEEQILKCAEVENYDRARELWEEQLQLLKDLDLWDVAQEFADPDRRTIAEELAADRGAYSYQHPRLGWIDVDDQGVASRRHDPLQDWADTVLPEFDRILLGSIAMLPLAAAGPAGRGGRRHRETRSLIHRHLLTYAGPTFSRNITICPRGCAGVYGDEHRPRDPASASRPDRGNSNQIRGARSWTAHFHSSCGSKPRARLTARLRRWW